jgi:hypothetical protein
VPSLQTTSDSYDVPGSVVAENLHAGYTRQAFAPTKKSGMPKSGEDDVHARVWHLDINTKDLRWDSYLKAGYYVCPPFVICHSKLFHEHVVV